MENARQRADRAFPPTARKENTVESVSLRGVGQLAPSDKLDVLFSQQGPELRAGEKVKIPLPPRRAPGIALARGRAHLFIIESQMNNEDSHARLKILQSRSVEIRPFLRRHSRLNRHGVIYHKIIGA